MQQQMIVCFCSLDKLIMYVCCHGDRDLGLMVEAEELLSDICKFYSEDQWMELSTKAYSLLADCQMKLRLEEKSVVVGGRGNSR